MSKRKTERLLEEVRRMAEHLGECDTGLSWEEVRNELRVTGIDPGDLKLRFHEAAKRLAERERLANRVVPLSLRQAIDATRPGDQMPNNLRAASVFAEHWLDKFRSLFVLPADLEVARAYRKSEDLSETDRKELDQLEKEFKEKVKKEHERKA